MTTLKTDTVPALPLVNWLHQEILASSDVSVANDLGIGGRVLYRFKSSLDTNNRPTDVFPRAAVEDLLHMGGVAPWEIEGYAGLLDEDTTLREGYCSNCEERVLADHRLTCLWCGTRTALPMDSHEREIFIGYVCPDCGGPKDRYRKRCGPCWQAIRPRYLWPSRSRPRKRGAGGRYVSEGGVANTCPSCGGHKAKGSQTCRPCFHTAEREKPRKKKLHGTSKITAEQLGFIHERYEEGMPIVQALALVDHDYLSKDSALSSMYRAFTRRGWKRRSKSDTAIVEIARDEWLETGSGRVANLIGRR